MQAAPDDIEDKGMAGGASLTRKVVDSNFLESPALRAYLSASPNNYVVMTAYVAMEAYKGDTLPWIYGRMEILAQYPKQVLVLKGMAEVCALNCRAAPVQGYLVDKNQSRDFLEFCQYLPAAKGGDLSLQSQLLENGREATAHIDKMLLDMPTLASGIDLMAKAFSPAELEILRRRERPVPQRLEELVQNRQMLLNLIQNVKGMAAYLFKDHPSVTKWPKLLRARDTFIFRYAICGYVSILMRIGDGGAGKTKPERLRNNDVIDVNIAAFATYFDGLLTADKRAAEIYAGSEFLLREVFAIPPWWMRMWLSPSMSNWAHPAEPDRAFAEVEPGSGLDPGACPCGGRGASIPRAKRIEPLAGGSSLIAGNGSSPVFGSQCPGRAAV
jgi:hypothetical protein